MEGKSMPLNAQHTTAEFEVDHEDYRDICSFCAEVSRSVDHNLLAELMPDVDVGRFILHETSRFVVIPGVGAVCDGYVLIVPKEHVLSMGHLDRSHDAEIDDLLERLDSYLHKQYGKSITAFEHGAESFRNRGGSCTDHAHMHVMPIGDEVDLLGPLRKEFDMRPAQEFFPALRSQVIERKRPYLWLRTATGRMWTCDAPNALSQYVRRILVDQLGRPGEWDWAVFPGTEYLRATISKFHAAPLP
jgi:diadenosine tetraphosphate (Ap4A) HIT family hydrolase